MKRSHLAVLGLMILLAVQPIRAESEREALVEERLAEAEARLDLSDEQLEQMRPVIQEAAEAQRSILAKYGIDLEAEGGQQNKLGMRDARKLRSEMQKVRNKTLEQLEEILTEEQLDEFKKLQEENREMMKKRIRGGR